MIRNTIELLARREQDGSVALLSPAVGIYAGAPFAGEGLVGGSAAGTLTVLGRTHDLLVPADVHGRVKEIRIAHRADAVEYGQALLLLEASAAEDAALAPEASGEAGEHVLRAPTTGIFYARPDPASPPFVSEGELLAAGQTAGLIEVMKCFSPIVHPGGATPSPALVVKVAVREGEEVRPGQVLFVLRPA